MEQIIVKMGSFLYNFPMKFIAENEINFAKLCKSLRATLHFTQKEMADKLGVELRSYQRYEAGQTKPAAEAAYKLALMDVELRLKDLAIELTVKETPNTGQVP